MKRTRITTRAPGKIQAPTPDAGGGKASACARTATSTVIVALVERAGDAFSAQSADVIRAAEAMAQISNAIVIAFTLDASRYVPEQDAQALALWLETRDVRHVLAPDTPFGAGDVARRVAIVRGLSVQACVSRIDASGVALQARALETECHAPAAQMLLIAPGCVAPSSEACAEIRPLPHAKPSDASVLDEGLVAAEAIGLAIEEADFIVAGGDGVGDWGNLERLAHLLGATLGATRVVCDKGRAARDRQIGASGAMAAPRCYVGFGVSGAPQHLQGLTEAGMVIALNRDAHAPIMTKRADLAIVADADAVIAALIAALEARR